MPGFGPGYNGGSLPHKYTPEEIDTGLMALIASSGSPTRASRFLDDEGTPISIPTLHKWKTVHAARYDELREKWSGPIEERIAHDMRELIGLSQAGTRIGVEKAVEKLERNEDLDPGRTAANLARVSQSSTDKLLSLTGRPSRITETRDAQAIIRGLVAKGILALPEGSEDGANDGG